MAGTVFAMLALVAADPALAADRCARSGSARVATPSGGPPRARPLNEMPPAREVLTVLREVNGCPVLLVREGGRVTEEPVGRPDRRHVIRP